MPKALPREERARRFVAADDHRHIEFLIDLLTAHDYLSAIGGPGSERLFEEARGPNPQNVAAEIAAAMCKVTTAHRKMLGKRHHGLTGAMIKLRALCDTELGIVDRLPPLEAAALMDVFYSLRDAALYQPPENVRHRSTGPRRDWTWRHPDAPPPPHVKPKVIAREGNVIRLSAGHRAA